MKKSMALGMIPRRQAHRRSAGGGINSGEAERSPLSPDFSL
ncbi:hypothetical protein J2T16_003552 [Paenibacillus intestini]|nr:hypothetical protein [Paenibacillus cucumis (ex Kampfer et al. 2016)]MDP9700645.1 hypothetical protein [Paenibacillus intestini]